MTDFNSLKDEEYRLTNRLSNLDISRRAVFAAACAERLYPLFEQYCDANGISRQIQLRHAIDRLWTSIESPIPEEELQNLAELCESFVPSQDSPWIKECIFGDAAAAAASYAILSRMSTNPQMGFWAADRAREVALQFVTIRDNLPANTQGVQTSMATAEYLTEVACQQEDLIDLETQLSAPAITSELARKIRERAVRNAVRYRLI